MTWVPADLHGTTPYARPADPVPECRPDVPVNPPDPGWNTNEFHPGKGWPAPDLPWLGGRSRIAPKDQTEGEAL